MSIANDRQPSRVVFLASGIKTPPFTREARKEVGRLLGRLQDGEMIPMPLSRPMPSIGKRCHELRVRDEEHNWRIIYRIDPGAIVIAEVFAKTTRTTPQPVIKLC